MGRDLLELWQEGVAAVRGEAAVRGALEGLSPPPDRIVAVGKAACQMAIPAMQAYPDAPALIVRDIG